MKYSPRRIMRMMVVMIVYSYEIWNEKPSLKSIFENDELDQIFDYKKVFRKDSQKIQEEQYKILSVVEKNYEVFIKNINKYVREDWKWDRMKPLLRSILLCASVELWTLDIGIVTNEYVEITKDFIPDSDDYKFVNKTIEEIGREYSEYKLKKKSKAL